jgi:hypothetical protein
MSEDLQTENVELISWQRFQTGAEGGGETVALPATDVIGDKLNA